MSAQVHFGGPDQPPRALRDLLEARVDAVPSGGAIDWVTYYFRDEALAHALVRAHQRGVHVRICLEGKPRNRRANEAVIAILERGIGDGLRVVHRWFGISHLHTKLYCFSDPAPHALVGSFNPSGNLPESQAIVADIGDQDRGHNLLVEIDKPALVEGLAGHVRALHEGADGPLEVTAGGYQAFFFPRRGRNPLNRRLAALGSGARVRIAASHMGDPSITSQLTRLARSGGVEIITHHTLRRSPERLVRALRGQGVQIRRYRHPDDLPMHAKFIIAEDGRERWSAFGSYNLTLGSRWLNRELLMFAEDEALWQTLDARWDVIASGHQA